MKILLADDERTIAVTLGDALRGAGHAVTVVADGEQALQALKSDSYDCVITDIRLPKADGLKVLRATKELQPSSRVILITAYASVEDAVKAIKEGAEDYIQKPFFNDDVLVRLKKLERLRALEQENTQLKEELAGRRQFGALVGKAPKTTSRSRSSTTTSSPGSRSWSGSTPSSRRTSSSRRSSRGATSSGRWSASPPRCRRCTTSCRRSPGAT